MSKPIVRLESFGQGNLDKVIVIDERGEITETSIGNIVLGMSGRKVTPHLEPGLLSGIFREELNYRIEIDERCVLVDEL